MTISHTTQTLITHSNLNAKSQLGKPWLDKPLKSKAYELLGSVERLSWMLIASNFIEE